MLLRRERLSREAAGFLQICSNFYFLNPHVVKLQLPVAQSESPNGGKKGDLSDCECGEHSCWCQTGLSVPQAAAADPLGFSPRHHRSRGFTGSVSEKRKTKQNKKRKKQPHGDPRSKACTADSH